MLVQVPPAAVERIAHCSPAAEALASTVTPNAPALTGGWRPAAGSRQPAEA